MYHNNNLIRFIILAPILPDLVILFLLFRRKLAKDVFWFVTYLSFCVVFLPVLFVIFELGDMWRYFDASWLYNAVALVLAFMVILEVYRNVLSGYAAIQRLAIFFIAAVGLTLLSVAVFVGTLGAPNADPAAALLLVIDRSVRIIRIGLI